MKYIYAEMRKSNMDYPGSHTNLQILQSNSPDRVLRTLNFAVNFLYNYWFVLSKVIFVKMCKENSL